MSVTQTYVCNRCQTREPDSILSLYYSTGKPFTDLCGACETEFHAFMSGCVVITNKIESRKADSEITLLTIIVNGKKHNTVLREVDYGVAVALAGFKDQRLFTVTYRRGWADAEGILAPGGSVALKDGMVLSIADTSGA